MVCQAQPPGDSTLPSPQVSRTVEQSTLSLAPDLVSRDFTENTTHEDDSSLRSDTPPDVDSSDEGSMTSDAQHQRCATPTESFLLLKETGVGRPGELVKLFPRGCRTQQMSDRRDECRLRVGIGLELSRWYSGSTLLFYFDYPSFGGSAHVVHWHFLEAIKLWTQEPGISLTLRETRDEDEATFRVAFSSQADRKDVALAFFPSSDEEDRTIYVHPRALSEKFKPHLTGILCHELGHVFGLRHEFAEYGEMPSVQFGVANEASVMNYPERSHELASWTVQEEDRRGLRAFMRFGGEYLISKTGEKFHRADFMPTPMTPGSFQRRRGGRSQGRHLKVRRYSWGGRLGNSLRTFWQKLVS